jgi:hypothetical protein
MIRLCGMDVEVLETNPGAWAKNAMGRSDSVYGAIYLREDMPLTVKHSTLMHEVLHMICDTTGLVSISENETAISTLATSLHSFIRDNPEVIKKMLE